MNHSLVRGDSAYDDPHEGCNNLEMLTVVSTLYINLLYHPKKCHNETEISKK